MVSLLDIAPTTGKVTVNGKDVDIVGVSAEGIAILLNEFPALRAALSGRGVDVSPEAMFSHGPKFVAHVIAAGTGSPGDPAVMEVAGKLPVGIQLEFLDKIIQQTLPGGVGPFVEQLEKLLGVAGSSGVGGKAPATKSPRPSKG